MLFLSLYVVNMNYMVAYKATRFILQRVTLIVIEFNQTLILVVIDREPAFIKKCYLMKSEAHKAKFPIISSVFQALMSDIDP